MSLGCPLPLIVGVRLSRPSTRVVSRRRPLRPQPVHRLQPHRRQLGQRRPRRHGPTPTPTIAPTSTATATPTSTPLPTTPPTPPPGTNLMQNGGFESGNTGWHYGGTSTPKRSQVQKHSGSYSLKLGASSGQSGDSTAYQLVTIPSSAKHATLSFYYWPSSNDSSTYGWQEANVVDSSGNVLQQLFVNTTNDQAWIQLSFDLSTYAGQTIGVQFLDHESSGGTVVSHLYVCG